MTAIRFAGSGGQGVQLAGIVLAEAAVISGKHVACTQTYGPESRGGSSRCDVLISDEEIDFPKARALDWLIALSEEAFDRHAAMVRAGGIVICDRSLDRKTVPAGVTLRALPIMDTARAVATVQSANVVALAVWCAATGFIGREDLLTALQRRLRRAGTSHRQALEAGWTLGGQLANAEAVGSPR